MWQRALRAMESFAPSATLLVPAAANVMGLAEVLTTVTCWPSVKPACRVTPAAAAEGATGIVSYSQPLMFRRMVAPLKIGCN